MVPIKHTTKLIITTRKSAGKKCAMAQPAPTPTNQTAEPLGIIFTLETTNYENTTSNRSIFGDP